jgi:hypothetical protein
MHRKEAQQASRPPRRILKPQHRHILVLIILVPRSLRRRIRQICGRRPVDIGIQNRRIPHF